MATILLIEDEEDIRLNVSEILKLANHNVVATANGKEGIEKAKQLHPDLIVSDVMMPFIDGFGVLHILKQEPETRNIPFIFLTSKNDRSDFRQAITLGANDYITKPFEGSDLLKAVEARLNQNMEVDTPADTVSSEPALTNTDEKDPIKALLETCDIMEFKKRHVIYKENSTPRFLYYIKSGKVKAYKSHEDGKDLVTGLFGEGDFLGHTALLEGTSHIETAEALEDCELVMIPRKKFEDLVSSNSRVMKKFMNLLAKSLMEKEQQILGFAYNTLRKKVAGALINYKKKYHTQKNEKFYIDIGREELATIAGTATESLIRTLTEFKKEKLIEMENGNIMIINESRLEGLLR